MVDTPARIKRSWDRSAGYGVDPEQGGLFTRPREIDQDTELERVAGPILARLRDRFRDTSGLVFFTDAQGRLTQTWAPSRPVRNRFDQIGALPGAQATEELSGTNAAGTAIEDGRSVLIVGTEHYQHALHQFACAAGVVRNPLTRHIVGTIGAAGPVGDDDGALLALVDRAARDLEECLLDQATATDRRVLREIAVRGWASNKSVIGMSRNVLMANDAGTKMLQRLDQPLLLEIARDTVTSGIEHTVELVVDGGHQSVSLRCVPVHDAGNAVGAIIEIPVVKPPANRSPRRQLPRPARLPLVGRSAEARSLESRIEAAACSAEPTLICGESGAGKTHSARALLAKRFPTTEARVVPCSDAVAVRELLDERARSCEEPVVLAHLELLSAELSDLLRHRMREGRPWTELTCTATTQSQEALRNPATDEFGIRLDVPALRLRRQDIAPLAQHFLRGVRGRAVHLEPDALQVLVRYRWPGNIRELRNVLHTALVGAPGDVRLVDLPLHVRRSATRRPLSPLEQAEADAILAALDTCDNNKVHAAALLQISRSRLYRKLREYGLAGASLS